MIPSGGDAISRTRDYYVMFRGPRLMMEWFLDLDKIIDRILDIPCLTSVYDTNFLVEIPICETI